MGQPVATYVGFQLLTAGRHRYKALPKRGQGRTIIRKVYGYLGAIVPIKCNGPYIVLLH